MKALLLECYKSRRKRLLLIVLAMAAVTFLWTAVGLRKMDDADRAAGYAYCLYQTPLLNAILLPVFISVLVTRLCDMEHKGNALKTLFTMEKPGGLFAAKFVLTGLYLLLSVVLQAASFLLIGRMYGFTEAPPVPDLLLYVLSQWLVSLFLALVVQILSLRYINQFIPLVCGLIGGFLGLMALFFPPAVMRLVPSAYYGLLSTVRMDWDPATRFTEFYYVPFPVWDCLLLTAVGVAVYILGAVRFRKREV